MSTCESCGKNPATVFFKAVVENQSTKINLCEECARERGILSQDWSFSGFEKGGFSLSDMIGGLTSSSQAEIAKSFKSSTKPVESRCLKCGTTYMSFKSSGFVGCSACYEAFYPAMRQIIKKIHGSATHAGLRYASGRPSSGAPAAPNRETLVAELAKLRKDLDGALSREAYEQAAVLRDKIKELEKKLQSVR